MLLPWPPRTDASTVYYNIIFWHIFVYVVTRVRRKGTFNGKICLLNFNYLVSVTAGRPVSPRGHM